jgi:hypothetical protein
LFLVRVTHGHPSNGHAHEVPEQNGWEIGGAVERAA